MSNLHEYKCPACNAGIEFDSSLQKMKCSYCGNEFDMEVVRDYDYVLNSMPEEDMTWESRPDSEWDIDETTGMRRYSCQACGGEVIADESTGATGCPYCGNPVIMMGQFVGDLKPDFVIPFKLDKNAAIQAMKNHFKGKRLLPKKFKDEQHIEEVKGIYVPFWLFDAKANASMRYKATRLRHWEDRNYVYTETSHYSVIREGSLGFYHVPVDGSSKMPDDMMESVEPYDFSQAVNFQTAYLSGYLADRYDVSDKESVGRANERIKKSTEANFLSTVRGYASVVPEQSSIRLTDSKTSYALYPVWLLTTSWEGNQYLFAMNGQTGKLVGNLPMDKAAFWKWLLGLTGIFSVIIYLFAWFGML